MGCGNCMKPLILKLAMDDLREIYSILSEYGTNPPKKFRGSFEKFCVNVSIMPHMYAQYELNPSYHRAVIAYDYLVFYKVENYNDTSMVRVYRVLYGKRDILPLLDPVM